MSDIPFILVFCLSCCALRICFFFGSIRLLFLSSGSGDLGKRCIRFVDRIIFQNSFTVIADKIMTYNIKIERSVIIFDLVAYSDFNIITVMSTVFNFNSAVIITCKIIIAPIAQKPEFGS